MEAVVLTAFFAAVAAVAITSIRSRAATKRLLIEHGDIGDGYAAVLGAEARTARWTALRWGLVLGGLGAALVSTDAMHLGPDDPAAWGVSLLGAALGYLAYFRASKNALAPGDA